MNKANLNEGYKPELSLLETKYRYPPLRPQTMIGFFKYWNKFYSYYFTLYTIIVNNSRYWTGNLVSRKK